jgi:3-isopropylmalate/(R)-2-methylmalate dehydratase small subunit
MNSLVISSVSGSVVPIPGNDLDTDRIVPARFLKEITFDRMGEYLFHDARIIDGKPDPSHPLNLDRYAGASIMLVENNFGCGSSREHAPQAILRAGFKAIIGESFAEIFSGNCKALGIITVTLPKHNIQQLFDAVRNHSKTLITIDIEASTINVPCLNQTFAVGIKSAHQRAFLNGTWDELAMLKLNQNKTKKLANELPYFHW